MPKRIIRSKVFFLDAVSLLLCGIGVGWLIGQSLSPVINTVVGSILALIASVVGSLAGIEIEPEKYTKELNLCKNDISC